MVVHRPPGPPNDRFGTNHLESLRHDLPAFFQRCARDYGDIFWFRLGPHPCYHFLHPDQLHEILVQKPHCFWKPRRFKQVFGRYEGNGLIVSDGTDWLSQRRWVQASLATTRSSPLPELAATLTDGMLDRWAGQVMVELDHEFRTLSLRLAVHTMFAGDFENELVPLREAIETLQDWSVPEFHRMLVAPRWWPWWGPAPARRALRTLNRFICRRLSNRLAQPTPANDVLGALLQNESGEGTAAVPSRTRLRDQLVTLLLSAYETMAATLVWSVWLLAQHSGLQRQICDELSAPPLESAACLATPREPDLLERCVMESLRLYPPVYLLTREVVAPVEIGGYRLEPGSQVYLSVWLTQRDSRWFERPEEFDPGRYTAPRANSVPRGAWLPFGLGPRGCPGKSWAMQWTRQILGQILQQYALSLPPSAPPHPRQAWKLSLHPAERLCVAIERRK